MATPLSATLPRHKLRTHLKDPTKEPVVLVACGSFSPPTFQHLRMFELARDQLELTGRFEVIGGFLSPVNDAYGKASLVSAQHRQRMCELALEDGASDWVTVDTWEMSQDQHILTNHSLTRFAHALNVDGGILTEKNGNERRTIRVMLLAGADLFLSMLIPDLWADSDMHNILGTYGCAIVERADVDIWDTILSHDILFEHQKNIHIIKPVIRTDMSSTKLRLLLRHGMSVKYLMPDAVIDYIQKHKLFTNP